MPVIAALDDPLPVFVAYNFSHMMRPHHDSANRRAARVCSVVRPGSGQIEHGTWVSSDLPTHEPPAPGARASGVIGAVTVLVMRNMSMMMMTVMSAMTMMVRPRLCRCCTCTKHCRRHYKVPKHESPRFGKGNRSAERAGNPRRADLIKFRRTKSSEIKSLLLAFSTGLNVQNVAAKGQ